MELPLKDIAVAFDIDSSDIALKDRVAEILKTTPEVLEIFENAYQKSLLNDESNKSNREYSGERTILDDTQFISRIVSELIDQTSYIDFDGENITCANFCRSIGERVTAEEILKLPEHLRPQLTGNLVKKDIARPSYPVLLVLYDKFLKEGNQLAYHIFRQGLDILDLDDIMYRMLDLNKNSMSYWFPSIIGLNQKCKFFKIPKTRIVKVPLAILQMTRLEYTSLTDTTKKIIDDWALEAFNLDINGDYFIKTGTYSSKFDFRNARVVTEKEVRELGEYLVFLQNQAVCMAGPLNQPCYYGVSTTNEFVVREFIPDTENNPTIYQGLPLRTEYRFFVDFDTREILGVSPYWEPTVMKNRFSKEDDANTPHMKHDYIIYKSHEDTLMRRYNENLPLLKDKVQELLNNADEEVLSLKGQWSLDIMQNGKDFYIIDMADAYSSALNNCIPEGKIKKELVENWIPQLSI